MQAVYYPANLVTVITYANDTVPYPREITGPVFSLHYTLTHRDSFFEHHRMFLAR